MGLQPLESYPAGGVDSRSNPLAMPKDRYLEVHDLWPQQDGSFRLRDGYSLLASGQQSGVPIHSITSVTGPAPNYTPLIVFWQGMLPYLLNQTTAVVSVVPVLGTPIQSASRFSYFYTNGHLHAFNGTDAKWFDGYVWRDVGLPQPNLTAAANVTVVESVRELSATEIAAVTLTLASGGTFPADQTGRTFYAAYYDLSQQELGPATTPTGTNGGFVEFAAGQELEVGALPISPETNWVKLLALTDDGGDQAHFAIVSTKQITGGVIVNQVINLSGTSVSNDPTVFVVPSFSVALSAGNLNSGPVTATVSGAEQSQPDETLPQSTTFAITGVEMHHGGEDDETFDYGTITINIIGTNDAAFQYTVGYGEGSTIGSLIAALAELINSQSDGLLTCTGDTITPTLEGSPAVYTITCTAVTDYPAQFPTGSFHISASPSPFGNRTLYDTGTVSITVGAQTAVADYGADDTADTVAQSLCNAINGLANSGAIASFSGAVITISPNTTGIEVQLTCDGNSFSPNDVVGLSLSGDDAYDGNLFTVISAATNTFNIFVPSGTLPIQTGQAQKLLAIGASGTGGVITAPAFFTALDASQMQGVPGSSVGGVQPGYQFYLSLYLPTAGGHVGNRVPIGNRIAPASRTNIRILGSVPTNPEQVLLIGRTGDGAEVPYVCIDNNGNWITLAGTFGDYLLLSANIDGNSEIPYRNFPPPGTLDYNQQLANLAGGAAQNPAINGTFGRAWVESDHMCGVLTGSPTIYRSGSAQDMREGQFVGLAEQSWDPADIETFPTANPVVCGQGYQQESWCFTAQDCGVLLELAGETQWQGPWNVGAAGQYAFAIGWNNLPFWVTGKKQLATVSLGGYQQMGALMSTVQAGPMVISGEYEAALLAKIGSQYLSQVEVVYMRIPEKLVDQLRINCLDSNGLPFTIIHDFNLRDDKAPYGQAYEEFYLGPLTGQSTPSYTQASVRNQFEDEICIAGGPDGNLYQFYDGGNDAGTEFVGEAFSLLNIGPQRTAVKAQEWWGDLTVQWYVTKKLNAAISFGTTVTTRVFDISKMNKLSPRTAVQGEEWNSHWNVPIDDPEMVNAYVLMRLASHSTDGTTALNTPPHVPLETYGRVWLVNPLAGASRGR